MSAETLRRTASLMRERAEAATPGPWSRGDNEVTADSRYTRDVIVRELAALVAQQRDGGAS